MIEHDEIGRNDAPEDVFVIPGPYRALRLLVEVLAGVVSDTSSAQATAARGQERLSDE